MLRSAVRPLIVPFVVAVAHLTAPSSPPGRTAGRQAALASVEQVGPDDAVDAGSGRWRDAPRAIDEARCVPSRAGSTGDGGSTVHRAASLAEARRSGGPSREWSPR